MEPKRSGQAAVSAAQDATIFGFGFAETGKKASQSFVYDATNRMVEGTNWKGDKSAYTYNGLGLRVNNLVTTHAGQTYDRDYVIDYTSPENDDLYVYAMGNGQLEYEQRHVYAGSERIEQITEKGNGGWERTLYVHEDVMGNTRYYTKSNGQNFAELQYDAWGQPVSPNKLVNNDHGNYVFAHLHGPYLRYDPRHLLCQGPLLRRHQPYLAGDGPDQGWAELVPVRGWQSDQICGYIWRVLHY